MNSLSIRSLGMFAGFSFAGLSLVACGVYASDPLPDASVVAARPYQKPPTISEVGLWGTIESLQSNGSGLKIKAGTSEKTKNQKEWLVVPKTDTEVTVEGTATLEYLHKGQLVEIFAHVVDNDHLDGQLKEITVVDKKTSHADKAKKTAANHAAAGAAGGGRIEAPKDDADALAAEAAKSTTGGGKSSGNAASGDKTTVVGKIVSRDDKKLSIASGTKIIKLELVDLPTIKVRLSDPKLVKAGSKIEVHGTGAQSKSGNEVAAKTIVVTLAEPLTGKKTASSSPKKVVGN